MKGYLSIRETSYKWGVSERRVNQYCTQGRIPGAERLNRRIPGKQTAQKRKTYDVPFAAGTEYR